jgi:UDP:flavonoid glycosyltransferase YjiC (YdhE family)
MLIIPIADHSEQFCNAQKIVRLGVALWLDPLTAQPKDICESINKLYSTSSFKSRAESLSKEASKYNGLDRLVNAVMDALR